MAQFLRTRCSIRLGLVLAIFACVCSHAQASKEALQKLLLAPDSDDARHVFQSWQALVERKYPSPEEEESRYAIFMSNLANIRAHNARGLSYRLGLNSFMDVSEAEFASTYLSKRLKAAPPVDHHSTPFQYGGIVPPDSVDWRGYAVTPAKQQGVCGSCWSFSATGAIEGAWYVATGNLVKLSEQVLLDCDLDNLGCDGGLPERAFQYVLGNGGIVAEDDYPYTSGATGREATCDLTKEHRRKAASITGFVYVPPLNEAALMQAVTMQPVSVVIQALLPDFQLYAGGIFRSAACRGAPSELDHAVLLVGFGTDESGERFWIMKNSWGDSWGEDGFMYMAVGSNSDTGACECGLCREPVYAVAAEGNWSHTYSICAVVPEYEPDKEPGHAFLSCPGSNSIITSIDFSSFGTPFGACGTFQQSSCHAPGSLAYVSKACIGETRCFLSTSNAAAVMGSDPCPSEQERLAVQATCSVPHFPPMPPRPSPFTPPPSTTTQKGFPLWLLISAASGAFVVATLLTCLATRLRAGCARRARAEIERRELLHGLMADDGNEDYAGYLSAASPSPHHYTPTYLATATPAEPPYALPTYLPAAQMTQMAAASTPPADVRMSSAVAAAAPDATTAAAPAGATEIVHGTLPPPSSLTPE